METHPFLSKVNKELVQSGRAFLAFRNDESTVYYNGNQLCNLSASDGFLPSIYNHYLPLVRSQTLRNALRKENYLETSWLKESNLHDASFSSVFEEILDNIEKEVSPESLQASRFYQFSPLNQALTHEIVLLDVEAAFSFTGEKTDRIDLVFYHTTERSLMFIEAKRLSDARLYPKADAHGQITKSAEVIDQLDRYRKRLKDEAHEINAQYNYVISYYNALSDRAMPLIAEDSMPVLGLLLVEFTRSAKDRENKKSVQALLKDKNYKCYAVGNTSSVTSATLTAIYDSMK